MSTKDTEPEPPPKDSLDRLAEFTKRILRVKRSELPDKKPSTGSMPDKEPCPDT